MYCWFSILDEVKVFIGVFLLVSSSSPHPPPPPSCRDGLLDWLFVLFLPHPIPVHDYLGEDCVQVDLTRCLVVYERRHCLYICVTSYNNWLLSLTLGTLVSSGGVYMYSISSVLCRVFFLAILYTTLTSTQLLQHVSELSWGEMCL